MSRRQSNSSVAEARAAVKALYERTPVKRLRNANEAQTRVEVIDRVLEIAGWSLPDVRHEAPSGTGDFLDYELRTSSEPWLVIEAKRVGRTFDLSSAGKRRADTKLRSLSTLRGRGGNELRDVLKQAATYCNDRGIPLACATNGYQWLFFRGLSTKSRAWHIGSALVFDGPDEIIAQFSDFIGAIGRASAGSSYLPELLERPRSDIPAPKIPREFLHMARSGVDPERAAVARAIGDALFADIYTHDRREMLRGCYVPPGVAGDFERSLKRLLKDSERAVDAGDEDVTRAATEEFVREIEHHERLSAVEYPVLVVGHVGAGKTTFLHKSLATLRGDVAQSEDPKAFCTIVDLEGHGQGGTIDADAEGRRVSAKILEKLGTAATTVLKRHRKISEGDLNHADPYSPETLRTLQRGKIASERRLGKSVWNDDPSAWNRKEYEILCELKDDSVELLPRFLRQLHNRFKRDDGRRYPTVIVLDNLDQATDDYQRLVYGLARRLAKSTSAILVLCVREDTYARGREADGFLSSSQLPFVFHVAAPALDHVLRRRVEYARSGPLPRSIKSEKSAAEDVCRLVDETLLPRDSQAMLVVAGLAGNNMREALGIVRAFVEGAQMNLSPPDPSSAYLLDCLIDTLGQGGLKSRCRITNCFDAVPSEVPLHGLPARILAYFTWAFEVGNARTLNEDVERLVGRFAAWGYPASMVREALERHVRDGTLRAHASAEARLSPRRYSITSAGYVHLTQLIGLPSYRVAMALITPWYDEESADRFISVANAAGGRNGVSVGDIAESKACSIFDAYLAQMLLREDKTLISSSMRRWPWLNDVLGRSSHIVPRPTEAAPAPDATARDIESDEEESSDFAGRQLGLGIEFSPDSNKSRMLLLVRDQKFRGTVWIPRILWALEWGRRDGRSRLSPSDIARVLTEHGELDVPRTNVARAFRDLKGDNRVEGLWTISGRRYEITDTGILMLTALLDENEGETSETP